MFISNKEYNPPERFGGAPPESSGSIIIADSTSDYLAYFYVGFILRNLIDFATFVLNLVVFLALLGKKKEFQCAFYVIVQVFMAMMLIVSSLSILESTSSEFIRVVRDSPTILTASMFADYFSSFYTIILISIMSVNRCTILIYPLIYEKLFRPKVFIPFLVISAIFTAALTATISVLANPFREFDEKSGQTIDYASNLLLISTITYISYAIPLVSSVLYVRIFFYLRKMKKEASLGKTRAMVDAAEVCNFHQGCLIFGTYLICLICHLLATSFDTSSIECEIEIVQGVVSALPQLGIPVSLYVCSVPVRKAVRKMFCGLNARVGSGSSSKGITKTTTARRSNSR